MAPCRQRRAARGGGQVHRIVYIMALSALLTSCPKEFVPGSPPCRANIDCTPQFIGAEFDSYVCDAKTKRCRPKDTFCSDGIVHDDEECDDGNVTPGDGCGPECRIEVCGDGIEHPDEECDDGNEVENDACRNDCTRARCGDGILRTDLESTLPGYEQCDDGNTDDDDGCLSNCVSATCGDGFVGPDEECDDGNEDNDDACRNNCLAAACGDGIIRTDLAAGQPGFEQCDDCLLYTSPSPRD